MTDIGQVPPEEKLSRIFRAISTPTRLQIVTAIGNGDLRQAYISQQLMELRDADLLETRREGRYIYYRLAEPRFLEALLEISNLVGIPVENLGSSFNMDTQNRDPVPDCCCPKCERAK